MLDIGFFKKKLVFQKKLPKPLPAGRFLKKNLPGGFAGKNLVGEVFK